MKMTRTPNILFAAGLALGVACTPPGNNNTPDGGGNNPNPPDAGDGCDPDEERRGVTIELTNAEGGARVCNATIVASDGAFSEELLVFGDLNDCEYFGLFDRAGTYTLTITAPDFNGATESVTVALDSCDHAITQRLSFALTPGDQPPPPPDAGPDPVDDAGPDPVRDAGPDPVPDAGPDPVPDAGPDPVQDAGADPRVDAGDAG